MNRTKHILLYDGECPLCTFQMRLIGWLDWFNTTSLLPIQDPKATALAPDITRADLQEAIHCVTPEDRIYRGARAFRFLGFRIPLLIPLGLFLWIPGVIWIAEIVYAFISRNRLFFSKIFGCKGACAILPEKGEAKE